MLVINLSEQCDLTMMQKWLIQKNIHILNIAGPRASQQAGIYEETCLLLRQFLPLIKHPALR